ncbi:MAG TPA: tetratricopeptide repeat protein, partial [Proteobacteria bacterium]|nr:tetratricopeptide repeat protein [Pseudomonadota bacterium]
FVIYLLIVIFSSSPFFSPGNPLLLPVLLIAAAIFVRITTPFSAAGGIPLLEIVSYSLLAAAVILSRPSPRAVILFILTLAGWGAVLAGYGLFRRLAGTGEMGNIAATFVNRNHFSAFLGMIAPLCLGLGLWGTGRSLRWLSGVFFLVLSAGVILTGSRGGVTAFTASTGAILILYHLGRKGKKRPGKYILLAGIFGVILTAVLLLPGRGTLAPITETTITELSVRTRLSIWQSTFQAFLARPWTGWGWGSFPYIYPLFKAGGVWYKVPHAHNELLQLLSEGGLVGFFAVVLCYVYASIRLTGSFFRENRKIFRALFSGTVGVLVYALIHSFFDFIFRLPANAFLFAGIIGLGLSIDLPGRRGIILSRKTARLISSGLIILLAGLVFFPMIKYFRSRLIYQQGLKDLALSRPARARADFSAAIDLEPDVSDYYLNRARAGMRLFENSGDKINLFNEIRADFDLAEKGNPWDAAIPRYQAEFYRGLQAYSPAEEKLSEALRRDPTNPFILMEQARLDLAQGRLNSAAHRLRRAAENYPPAGSECLDMILSQTSDYRILRQVPPPAAWLHRQLGYKLREKGMWEEAGEEFERAISLDPSDPSNWLARGEADLLRERYDQAQAAFEKAISIKPLDGYAWSRLGELFFRTGKKEKALDCYRKGWSYQSGGRSYAGMTYRIIRDTAGSEAARRFLDEVTVRTPDWGWPYGERAVILIEDNDYLRAREEINEALMRDPDHPYYRKLKKNIERKLSGR